MSSGGRRLEQQNVFVRQATILRRNLHEWDRMLRDPRGEDWPTMLGRLNAALNQTVTMDKSIEDVMEHFVYLPKKSTVNANDIPFFLSTRLDTPALDDKDNDNDNDNDNNNDNNDPPNDNNSSGGGPPPFKKRRKEDPVVALAQFETRAAKLAAEYEENMVRFEV